MQKTQDLLLILSNEERDEAEDFILRRLKRLYGEVAMELEALSWSARSSLEQIRQAVSQKKRENPEENAPGHRPRSGVGSRQAQDRSRSGRWGLRLEYDRVFHRAPGHPFDLGTERLDRGSPRLVADRARHAR